MLCEEQTPQLLCSRSPKSCILYQTYVCVLACMCVCVRTHAVDTKNCHGMAYVSAMDTTSMTVNVSISFDILILFSIISELMQILYQIHIPQIQISTSNTNTGLSHLILCSMHTNMSSDS